MIGIHRNWCFVQNIFRWKVIAGAIFPSLFVTEKEAKLFYPLTAKFANLLLEFGYFHLHATKPDTVGECWFRSFSISYSRVQNEYFIVIQFLLQYSSRGIYLEENFGKIQLLEMILSGF